MTQSDLVAHFKEEYSYCFRSNPTKYIVFMGLPGSGKTTLAKKLLAEIKNSVYYNLNKKDEAYQSTLGGMYYSPSLVLIDGLFSSIQDFVDQYIEFRSKKEENKWHDSFFLQDSIYMKRSHTNKFKDSFVEFVYFLPNVGNCQKNDEIRNREALSTITINRMYLNMEHPKEKYPDAVTYEIEVPDYSGKETAENILLSYWVSGEDIAEGFKDLDTWLENNYPTITFLQYKKISKLIETESERVYDWYDETGTGKVRWRIDLTKVKELIGE